MTQQGIFNKCINSKIYTPLDGFRFRYGLSPERDNEGNGKIFKCLEKRAFNRNSTHTHAAHKPTYMRVYELLNYNL